MVTVIIFEATILKLLLLFHVELLAEITSSEAREVIYFGVLAFLLCLCRRALLTLLRL